MRVPTAGPCPNLVALSWHQLVHQNFTIPTPQVKAAQAYADALSFIRPKESDEEITKLFTERKAFLLKVFQ